MAYGLSTRAFVDDAADKVAKVQPNRSSERAWQALSEACKLEAVEQALRAANDRIDGYPLAL